MISDAFTLRRASAGDGDFIRQMVVAAANWAPDRQLDAARLLRDPAIAHYVDDWPRSQDFGSVAVDAGHRPIGAAWARYFGADDPGYGFVSTDVPELSVAVVERWRGRGVGRALLRELVSVATARGVRRLSLSVERANPAQRLYLAEGFVVVARGRDSDTMVKDVDDRDAGRGLDGRDGDGALDDRDAGRGLDGRRGGRGLDDGHGGGGVQRRG